MAAPCGPFRAEGERGLLVLVDGKVTVPFGQGFVCSSGVRAGVSDEDAPLAPRTRSSTCACSRMSREDESRVGCPRGVLAISQSRCSGCQEGDPAGFRRCGKAGGGRSLSMRSSATSAARGGGPRGRTMQVRTQ